MHIELPPRMVPGSKSGPQVNYWKAMKGFLTIASIGDHNSLEFSTFLNNLPLSKSVVCARKRKLFEKQEIVIDVWNTHLHRRMEYPSVSKLFCIHHYFPLSLWPKREYTLSLISFPWFLNFTFTGYFLNDTVQFVVSFQQFTFTHIYMKTLKLTKRRWFLSIIAVSPRSWRNMFKIAVMSANCLRYEGEREGGREGGTAADMKRNCSRPHQPFRQKLTSQTTSIWPLKNF